MPLAEPPTDSAVPETGSASPGHGHASTAPAPAVSRASVVTITVFSALFLFLTLWTEWRNHSFFAGVLAAFASWNFAIALLLTFARSKPEGRAIKPRSRSFLITPLALIAASGCVAFQLWRAFHAPAVLATTDESVRLLALCLGSSAVGSWFFAALVRADASSEHDSGLLSLRHLLLVGAIIQASGALLLLLRLATGTDWLRNHAFCVGTLVTVLGLESLISVALSFYQPRSLRERAAPIGKSLVLTWVFQRDHPLRSLAHSIEATFGLKVGETALFPFLQRTIEPALLGAFILLWLSSACSMVPADSTGVLVTAGRYSPTPLGPGLHAHWPWPLARLEIVPSRRIQTLTLGFDQDLEGPILWAEQHYAGEKSLLVGRGEELLTVSVPIHFRISDPTAFVQNTRDPLVAIGNLGYRELLDLTTTHTSFGLMTTDRTEVTEALHRRLQAACDRHHLGLEIVWVGLKDIHPPVAVAPAFQDVISAEEEKLTTVDRERATSLTTLQEAQSAARRLRTTAEAFLHERTALATGESARFQANAAADRNAPVAYRTRRTSDSAELGLREASSLLVVPSGSARTEYFLDVKSPNPVLPALAR